MSSLKDANPASGATPTWGTISWTAAVPDGTDVKFQAAASNSPLGPFAFVGPDGTASTYFGNGASLAQFNGSRYLKYKAVLSTSKGAATPVLSDVTVCFEDVPAVTTLSVDPASGPYQGTTTLSATLSAGGVRLAGRTIAFTLLGTSVGSAVTDGAGVATIPGVSLAGISAGTHPDGVAASFAGEPGYAASTGSSTLGVARAPLSVKADDQSKLLNAPNPPLTGVLTGVLDGDNITATYTTTAVTTSPVGAYPIVPVLVDPDGRLGNYDVTIVNGTLTIGYASGGLCLGSPGHEVLPPLDASGSRVVQQKSTVPVKFRVCDANGVSVGTPGVVASFQLVQIIQGSVVTSTSATPVSTTPDTTFRWDAVAQQWIFNLSTKNLAGGATYVYRIVLADGSAITFRFTLK